MVMVISDGQPPQLTSVIAVIERQMTELSCIRNCIHMVT